MMLITPQPELVLIVPKYSRFAPDLLTVKFCAMLGLLVLDAKL
jgi:hypothetical protein